MSRRKRQREYYALAGCNAYGVYNNYDEALLSKTYVKKANIKKFSNFEDAKEWAEERFYEFQNGFEMGAIAEIKRTNWTYHKKIR